MVFDSINNLYKYIHEESYRKIETFLQQVSSDMPEGKYGIWGEKIFARVLAYDTNDPEKCVLEAHNKYIDIQSTIYGAEGIDIYPREKLQVSLGYDEVNDVIFFRKSVPPMAHTVNFPGQFTMLMPNEAHSPQQRAGAVPYVKKFVIKIMAEESRDLSENH